MRVPVGPRVDDVANAVRASAANELDLILDDLEAWVNCDSPSSDAAALSEVVELISERLQRYGATIDVQRVEGGPALRAVAHGQGRRRIALLCHHDTVFPRGTAGARPFARSGDAAIGPGVADMKGGIAVAAHVLRLLKRSHAYAFGRLELISLPDEEIRSVPFPGIGDLVGCDAVFCMECGRPGDGIVTARKGGDWVTVTGRGRAAHAGVAPSDGRSALLAACREALRIADLDGQREGLGVHVTMLHAGEGLASVASSASMMLDLRGWHAEDLDWVLGEIGRFGRHDSIEFAASSSGRVPPLERTLGVKRLASLAVAIGDALGTPVHEVATGGLSDACWTAAAGIPTLDGLGPIGGYDHSPDEVIEVPSIAARCGLVAGLIAGVELER
ncbi:MAG: M20/M25/M40 family metallo-hydrolase [Actinomycetota bacterium]|nr:M20/M25/M40 family metallo-hydrolase [Actinomycetota bacterium]